MSVHIVLFHLRHSSSHSLQLFAVVTAVSKLYRTAVTMPTQRCCLSRMRWLTASSLQFGAQQLLQQLFYWLSITSLSACPDRAFRTRCANIRVVAVSSTLAVLWTSTCVTPPCERTLTRAMLSRTAGSSYIVSPTHATDGHA
jgi:hypothetical protein